MPDQESILNYKQARAMGRKYVSDHSKDPNGGMLPVLDDVIRGVGISGELRLGECEIPLNWVVGTRTSNRSNAFAGNFMPLLPENTEFGVKWCNLYNSHIEEGIRDPVRVYEYLNRYFVQEGNKRVSVLRYCNALTIYAKVTRLIPRRDPSNKDISIYYEFLDFDRREIFNNLWFSHRGSFTKLIEIVRDYQMLHPECAESTADLLREGYKYFRAAYHEAQINASITTGDAFLEYVCIFGFDPTPDLEQLAVNVRNSEHHFELLAQREDTIPTTIEQPTDSARKSFSFFSRKTTKLKLAMAYESTPKFSLWTATHDLARQRLEREYGDQLEFVTRFNIPSGDAAYGQLNEMLEAEQPDILLATSPNMSDSALRLTLEHPDQPILICDRAQPKKDIVSYFPKLHEGHFLAGVLAGSMTRTDTLGYMTAIRIQRNVTSPINAFTQGARIVNPNVKIINYRMNRTDLSEADFIQARCEMAKRGCDIALCKYEADTPLVRKGFPGVIAQLYQLSLQSGYPLDCFGAIALDWTVFYHYLIEDVFQNRSNILDVFKPGHQHAMHFGWGIQTGILDVFGVDAFMGHNTMRLMRIFRHLVMDGKVHPFDGPIFDQEGQLRCEKHDTLSLLEAQTMDWYAEGVIETVHAE